MAYFERADETDKLVLCNICDVNCLERGIMAHRSKCAVKHREKFARGLVERCEFDSGHIVKPGMMDLHLEFCVKRQQNIVSEYQRTQSREPAPLPVIQKTWTTLEDRQNHDDDDWNRIDINKAFISKLKDLKLEK